MSQVRSYLSTFSLGATAKFFTLGIGLILEIVIVRALGAHDYGVYSFGVAVLGVALLLISRGANSNIIRFGAPLLGKNGNSSYVFFHWVRKRVSINILIFLPFALLAIPILEKANNAMNTEVYLLMIAAACIVCFTHIHQSVFHAKRDSFRAQLYDSILRPILMLVLLGITIYAFHHTPSPIVIASYYVVGSVITLIISYLHIFPFIYLRPNNEVIFSLNKDAKLWQQSTNEFFYIQIVSFILRRLDIIIVTTFVSAAEAGNYKVAIRVAELVALPLWISDLYVGPMISRLYHENKVKDLQALLTFSTCFAFVLALAGSVVLYLSGDWILSWFGEDFSSGFRIIMILIFASLIDVAFGPVTLMLTMTGQPKLVFKVQLVAALISLVLMIILSWLYGIVGTALAIVIGTSIWNLWLWGAIRNRMKLDTSFLSSFKRVLKQ